MEKKILSRRLEDLQEATGCPLTQTNGERIFGPPPNWRSFTPTRGSEVFIGKIPRDCYEDELVPVLNLAGPLYMLRLKMDFSGHNRGFAFALYESPEVATSAVALLNKFAIRPGVHLGVTLSVDNRELVIYGLPYDSTPLGVARVLESHVSGFQNITIHRNTVGILAIVEFDTHFAAAKARRVLVPGCTHLWNNRVAVDWVDPRNTPLSSGRSLLNNRSTPGF
ncbi:putative RNA-binding protein 46 [Arctopsyche grandis]|uniref:putative RNA-binding protein 46 n=1 Tax=Arctopsyche grandis TaxID=121162 RepID=UPI00406D9E56